MMNDENCMNDVNVYADDPTAKLTAHAAPLAVEKKVLVETQNAIKTATEAESKLDLATETTVVDNDDGFDTADENESEDQCFKPASGETMENVPTANPRTSKVCRRYLHIVTDPDETC